MSRRESHSRCSSSPAPPPRSSPTPTSRRRRSRRPPKRERPRRRRRSRRHLHRRRPRPAANGPPPASRRRRPRRRQPRRLRRRRLRHRLRRSPSPRFRRNRSRPPSTRRRSPSRRSRNRRFRPTPSLDCRVRSDPAQTPPEPQELGCPKNPGGSNMASAKHENKAVATTDEGVENRVTNGDAKLGVRRFFTIPGRDPFNEIEWETRDALIPGKDGPAFEQRGVEFPKFWSQTATNIVAQKYFRGRMTSPDREKSVKQMIGRIVDTVGGWGRADGYFADEDEAKTFEDELKAILVNQLASFNSPVWFNVGFEEKPQCSACFILSIEDSMEDILDWIRREGVIFRGGSGSGVNLSRLRSSKEQLSKGGYASGPVSFMRGADASAGTIKSGGKTRRAAKMVVLDVDHPDIQEFIWCKAHEERKARVLEA